jgi:hypothetical protein
MGVDAASMAVCCKGHGFEGFAVAARHLLFRWRGDDAA